MIERDFDIPFIAKLAFREKQIQQSYRPIIAVHKWFARRPGTLFRGLLLSEFVKPPLEASFYDSHDLAGIRVADPFMGGGTPVLEANRIGCQAVGCDINPMAFWIVKEEIEHIDLVEYRRAAETLRSSLEREIGRFYRTRCALCGSPEAHVKYFLWVKTLLCSDCGKDIDLFPGYLVAQDRRHPKNVFLCAACGELVETESRRQPGLCPVCAAPILPAGPARRNRCPCPSCGAENRYPAPDLGPPRHRLFAMEYHCPDCKLRHKGRFFKRPDDTDLALVAEIEEKWERTRPGFVPDDSIPRGDETDRLHRWGYRRYRDMFNARQLVALELSCRAISQQPAERLRNALATNLSDLLRYQNMLCRYDSMALKSLDIFSVHGFPVGLIQCESNVLGISRHKNAGSVGSGGWLNIIDKYARAKAYCERPFEIRHHGKRRIKVPIRGEWIGDRSATGGGADTREVQLSCQSATTLDLPPESLDAVFTDPPYFGNVQYAELMDFCYVWLRRLVGAHQSGFAKPSTRALDELTGNENMARGLAHFAEGLSAVFRRMATALRPGSPLVFTYHHNKLETYATVAAALLDSSLVCSASLPCPAEMGASIHISGTRSSIVDTVFVCRSTGAVPQAWIVTTPEDLAALVKNDLVDLQQAGLAPTEGDIHCIVFGQVTRLAVWNLRTKWELGAPTEDKLARVREWIDGEIPPERVLNALGGLLTEMPELSVLTVRENPSAYGAHEDAIPF